MEKQANDPIVTIRLEQLTNSEGLIINKRRRKRIHLSEIEKYRTERKEYWKKQLALQNGTSKDFEVYFGFRYKKD